MVSEKSVPLPVHLALIYTNFLMDLLLLFAGHLYPRIDSFPFRLRLHASVLSLLAEIVLLCLC